MPEVLHGTRPVNACHQSINTQTSALDDCRIGDEKSGVKSGQRANLVKVTQKEYDGEHRDYEPKRRKYGCALAGSHRAWLRERIPPIISGSCARKSKPPRTAPSPYRTMHKTCSAR